MKITFLLFITNLLAVTLTSEIHYHYHYNQNNKSLKHNDYVVDRTNYKICGTKKCKDCSKVMGCYNTSDWDLDRDKDKEDLKGCPYGYHQHDYDKENAILFIAATYLRICKQN